MATYFGIDCAKWQGTINWAKVKSAGVQVAILKATDKNNGPEPAFARNYAGATAQGIKIGCFADTVEGGKKWRDLGVKFIGYGCDTYIFMQAAKADVAAFAK